MVQCTITLESNDRGFYYAGESIQGLHLLKNILSETEQIHHSFCFSTGSLKVFLDQPKKFRGNCGRVYIKFVC